jgi:hypothetical protein
VLREKEEEEKEEKRKKKEKELPDLVRVHTKEMEKGEKTGSKTKSPLFESIAYIHVCCGKLVD